MKNIFSKGAKTVAGAVLVGATIMVGLGVVNNFSGGSQKAANEMALSRFDGSAYNNTTGGSSASRADLEMQMSATQDGYRARFLKGKSDGTDASDAYSSDGAYEEGVRADEGFVYASNNPYGPNGSYGANGVYGPNGAYGNGDIYQPFNSTYEQGEAGIGEDFSSDTASYGERQFQAAQAAAAAAVAEGKGSIDGKGNKASGKGAKNKGGKVRPATQINRLAASSGGSSFGSGGAGGSGYGSGSFGGGSAMGGGDSNTRALPQTKPNQTDAEAFKFGRAGAIGGFNVGLNGSEYKGGNSKGRGAAADLWLANAYSGKARASASTAGAKSLAAAAFDGSNPEELSPSIESDASPQTVTNSLFDTNGLGDSIAPAIEGITQTFDELDQQEKDLRKLQDKIVGKYWLTLVLSIIMAILLYGFVTAFYSTWNPWMLFGALVVTAGALAFIYGMVHGFSNGFGATPGDDSILGMIEQMKDEERFGMVNDNIDFDARINDANIFGYSMAGMIAGMWLPAQGVAAVIGGVFYTCIGIFDRWGYKVKEEDLEE